MTLVYRPDIDGLRALAVLPVVFYHAGLPGFSGGFVGVDVFFVISGYLITGLIWQEIAAGRFSLIGFYERRARRILPALLAVTAAVLAAGLVLLPPGLLMALARSALAATMFVSNLFFWRTEADYFAAQAELAPLLHSWSLAVEEQFYIVMPLLLMLLARRGRRAAIGGIAVICVASFGLSVWLTARAPAAAFYLAPTRAWELGLGALLVFLPGPSRWPRAMAEAAALAGVAAILASVALYDDATVFPGLAAAVPAGGAAALIWAGRGLEPTAAGRLLALRGPVGVGLISYSLYLWHWPILAFLRLRTGSVDLPPGLALGALAASAVLAVASWRFVERPFRRRSGPGALVPRTIFAASAAAMLALCGLSGGLLVAQGLPARIPAEIRAVYAAPAADDAEWKACANRAPAEGLCRIGARGAPISVLLWGDSHAGAAMGGVSAFLADRGLGGEVAFKNACAPLLGVERADKGAARGCAAFNAAVLDRALAEDGPRVVILHARWALVAEGRRMPGEAGVPAQLGWAARDAGAVTGADNFPVFSQALADTVAALRGAGRLVVLMEGVPEIGWRVPLALGNSLYLGAPPPQAPTLGQVAERNARANAVLRAAARAPGVYAVGLADRLCTPDCAVALQGRPLYQDDDHLSLFGATTLIPPLLAVLPVW